MGHPEAAAALLEPLGRDLQRPECVLGSRTGDVFVSDWRGGVTMLRRDGSQQTWIGCAGTFELRPNGIALTRDGTFLIAHLGDTGGIWELERDGRRCLTQSTSAEIHGRPQAVRARACHLRHAPVASAEVVYERPADGR